jgi:hypothetical protein
MTVRRSRLSIVSYSKAERSRKLGLADRWRAVTGHSARQQAQVPKESVQSAINGRRYWTPVRAWYIR